MSKESIQNKEINIIPTEEKAVIQTNTSKPKGFENEESNDFIIPRFKVIQLLSSEKKEKKADEGDIINSLSQEKLNGATYIPVFKYNTNICWKPRADGGGIACIARQGKVGEATDGTILPCLKCKKNLFDNTKQGKDAQPICTAYINYFGFIMGTKAPIILSFSKTNIQEGRKLFSLAKVSGLDMWKNAYKIDSKLMSKNTDEWYNIIVNSLGPIPSEEDISFGESLYFNFINNVEIEVDMAEDDYTTEGIKL